VATIGFGSTLYEDGRKVTLRDKQISMERADTLLMLTLRRDYLPAVKALVPVLLTPNQVAALVSFVYNVGVGALKSSTLRKRILAGRMDDVPAEFLKWDKAGGRKLKGLTRRREAEASCFMSG
jgi:lysozyme